MLLSLFFITIFTYGLEDKLLHITRAGQNLFNDFQTESIVNASSVKDNDFYAGLVSSDEYYGIIKVNGVQLYVRQDAGFCKGDVGLLTSTSESTGVKDFYAYFVVNKPCSKNQPMKK